MGLSTRPPSQRPWRRVVLFGALGTAGALVAAGCMPPPPPPPPAEQSQTFAYTGAKQRFVVPAGVESVVVDAFGGSGGANGAVSGGAGGHTHAAAADHDLHLRGE